MVFLSLSLSLSLFVLENPLCGKLLCACYHKACTMVFSFISGVFLHEKASRLLVCLPVHTLNTAPA
jgi:hypothetical protein